MTDSVEEAYHRAAAAYLRELLLRPGRYRRRWEQYAERSRPGQVNQLAVAEVLARYRWSHPRATGDSELLARQLKDTVFRAISGRMLSRATLTLFVEAFGFSEGEAERLRRLWAGSDRISVLSGPRALRPEAAAVVEDELGPPGYQTVSLHDHLSIGDNRLVMKVRTLKVIEAITDRLDRIPFLNDTDAVTLEVGQGCAGVSGYISELKGGFYLTNVMLAKTLALGETLTLEYWTTYHYLDEQVDKPKCEYRRAVMRRVENVDIRVEFPPDQLPRHVWWSRWAGVDGAALDEEPVDLDSQFSSHRFMRFIEETVVGFRWQW
ncbi:MAG TPA: hypothetical protein VGH27_30695 [Streptosporangiaceae bacterium]